MVLSAATLLYVVVIASAVTTGSGLRTFSPPWSAPVEIQPDEEMHRDSYLSSRCVECAF